MIPHANTNQKKAELAIFMRGKVDFKTKNTIRDKEWYFMMLKGTIHHKDLTILNMCMPNNRALKYI